LQLPVIVQANNEAISAGADMNGESVTTRKLQSAVIGLGLVAVLFVATFAHGSSSPFTGLSGAWAGPGTVTLDSGAKESIRCRANYSVDGSGLNLKLDLRCASESYKFELQSSVAHNNGEVHGFWDELTHRVGGTVTGKATGEQIEVRVEGPIAAMLDISTRADQQTVAIQSPGSKMSEVAISLSRVNKQVALK
jgi:hypothetical protein